MVITWYGEGCFKIQSGESVVLTDPFEPNSGLTAPRFKADIILKTLSPFPLAETSLDDTEKIVFGAGEYNFKDINIWGFNLEKESTENFIKSSYLIEIENIKLFLMGHASETPEPSVLERLEDVGILIIPGGGKPFINQKIAVKTIKQIEPKIVIPSFYKIPGLKRTAEDLKEFLEEFNHKKYEPQEKLTIKNKELSEIKSTQIVILKN